VAVNQNKASKQARASIMRACGKAQEQEGKQRRASIIMRASRGGQA
jgi:hypothetical protein